MSLLDRYFRPGHFYWNYFQKSKIRFFKNLDLRCFKSFGFIAVDFENVIDSNILLIMGAHLKCQLMPVLPQPPLVMKLIGSFMSIRASFSVMSDINAITCFIWARVLIKVKKVNVKSNYLSKINNDLLTIVNDDTTRRRCITIESENVAGSGNNYYFYSFHVIIRY